MPVKVPIPYFPASYIEKTVIIRVNPAVEENLDTPVTLPTNAPDNGQVKVTLQSSDFPQITPNDCYAIYIAVISIVGRFTTAGTLYRQLLLNGNTVASSSGSVSANYYYHVQGFIYGVSPGDTIELKVWSSVSGSNYDFTAYQIQPTRLSPPEALNTPIYVSYEGVVLQPGYVGPKAPTSTTANNYYVYFLGYLSESFSGSKEYPIFQIGYSYKLFRIGYGDTTNPNFLYVDTATSRALILQRNYFPSVIKLRIWRLQ